MTIRHLRIFAAVAETGKMSAAAERCFISQPTVSQTIHELEEHYGVRLFDRLSKKLYITEAGRQLLSYAQKVLSQYDLLEANMKDCRPGSNLRLGATITVGASLLSSIINDLRTTLPSLHIYSCICNTSLIEQKLLNSELDVALVEGMVNSPNLIAVPVVDDYLVLAVSKTHPLAHKKQIHVHDLSQYEFVMRENGSGTRKLFQDYMEAHGTDLKIAMEATCLDAIKNGILYNDYAAVISVRLLENEIRNKQIYIFRNQESDWNRKFYLVYHKDRFFSEPMQLLESIVHVYKTPEFVDSENADYLTGCEFDITEDNFDTYS